MRMNMLRLLLFISIITVLAACSGAETKSDDQPGSSKAEKTANEAGEKDQDIDELFHIVKHNYPTNERIQALKNIAMSYYFNGGDVEKAEDELFTGKTLDGDKDVMEEALKQASAMKPHDMDLKFALASTQMLQKETSEALNTYKEITDDDKNYFNAWLMHGIYSKIDDNKDAYHEDFDQLEEIDKTKAEEYEKSIKMVENIKDTTLQTQIPDDLAEQDHAFVIYGYALSDEGEMEDTLKERLKIARKAAEAYPDSTIIVTGGMPEKGNTEADVMQHWLTDAGIDKDRIIKEDMAADTIENALFTMKIIDENDLDDVTLITSASHMRRALATFNQANNTQKKHGKGIKGTINHITYMDFDDPKEAKKIGEDEERGMYRDVLRTSGVWQLPGMHR